MQIETVLWVFLAAIFALSLIFFQYYYKTKRRGKLIILLSFLRFLGVFGILLLLINPKFIKNEYNLEKTNLVILTDNSSSIKDLNADKDAMEVLDILQQDSELKNKFKISNYNFGTDLQEADSTLFTEQNTNIGGALKSIKDVYENTNAAIILLTDGNQTVGEEYEFFGNSSKIPVFPVVLGDTTKYEDLKITHANINKYAFLENKYPLEIYVAYNGDNTVNAILRLFENGKEVYQKKLSFSKSNNSKVVETSIKATSVGVKRIKAEISVLEGEKNKVNNTKIVALEVIDEKTNIAIITNTMHPDIGALKKSLESNEQRSVSIFSPKENLKILDNMDLFVLYQPTYLYKEVFDYVDRVNKNSFIIAGTKTDWNFLNTIQSEYNFETGYPIQEIAPIFNSSFSKFDVSDFNIDNFPPLKSNVSQLISTNEGTILNSSVKGIKIESPLLSVTDNKTKKQVFLFGENIWKWRIQTYRNQTDFNNFDDFIGKLILYLSSSKPRNRFLLDYKQLFSGSNEAYIRATVFDETFVFDTNATVVIKIRGKENGIFKEVPMLLNQLNYEVDLSALPAGDYDFTAKVKNTNSIESGSFTILDYDMEKQFSHSDYQKLSRLAITTTGKLYYPNTVKKLNKHLKDESRFKPVQRSKENIVPLVEFKFLLALVLLAFAAEWFIRKYNGLT